MPKAFVEGHGLVEKSLPTLSMLPICDVLHLFSSNSIVRANKSQVNDHLSRGKAGAFCE